MIAIAKRESILVLIELIKATLDGDCFIDGLSCLDFCLIVQIKFIISKIITLKNSETSKKVD